MTVSQIQRVAVLGSGVMGQGIAAHLANAGIPSVLYDLPLNGFTFLKDEPDTRAIAKGAVQNAGKLKPAAFFNKAHSALITPASFDDDGDLLADCDLIIEVVAERLDIKRGVFDWVAKHRKDGSILTSNTSGISLAAMAKEMNEEMRQHFMITHFFNPVRYMRLLELVVGPDTKPEIVDLVSEFGAKKLGKGIVYGKDTANFVANRIGTFGMVSVFRNMEKYNLDVEDVDVIFGPPMGRPKSAVFRTADLVGLDTLSHTFDNVYENCPDDEQRDQFQAPSWLKTMLENKILGDKTGKGIYQKTRDDKGKRLILKRNLETGEYSPVTKPRFGCVKAAKKAKGHGASVKAMISYEEEGAPTPAAQFAWNCTAETLIYAANRLPEIADDVVNIDRAMRWGFAWDLGPFETWDAIGVAESVARMKSEGLSVPAWVDDMLSAGRSSFYARDGGTKTYWDPLSGSAKAVSSPNSWLLLSDLKSNEGTVLERNPSASLIDLGDGILGLEFHSKMNAIDNFNTSMYIKALDIVESGRGFGQDWQGLVVGNQDKRAFCAGANIFMILLAAKQNKFDEVEQLLVELQTTLQRAKYCSVPVITAPFGLTLGGGCEVAMQSSGTQAAGELYMGLVEVGVGLLPAGGGCKEVLSRYLGDIPAGVDYDPNPFIQQAFKNIALGQVSTSCEEARNMGYLRPSDRVTMDIDALLMDAKNWALGLATSGYTPPQKRRFKLSGADGRAAIELFLVTMQQGGYASEHDLIVGKEIANVLTGGNKPAGTWVTEEDILDLEREGFLRLLGTQKTQERISYMLQNNKPLRN